MLCFMCRDLIHTTAEVWCCFELYKWLQNADLEAFAVPLVNNMEAKHCFGQTLYSIINEKSVWRAYLMCLHAKTKTLG